MSTEPTAEAKRRRETNKRKRQRQKKKKKQQQEIEKKSRSRSHSTASSSHVFSLITDEDILRTEIKKPDLNRSDFQEMEELGGGDFSAVELAIYVPEAKYVALKILDKKSYQQHEIVPHAFAEKHMLRTIDSPFKIKYLGKFQNKRYLFLVTEYVEGRPLIKMIQQNRGLDEETSCFYAAQLVLFFETLHAQDAIFRDLKPENILISHWDRYLKVIDFGYSCLLDKKSGTRKTFCGSMQYLCPEKLQGVPYTAASDIWSLGILLFVMLCDKFPLKFDSHDKKPPGMLPQMKTLHKHIPEKLKLLFNDKKQILPLSAEIQELIAWMLAFSPDKRPTISQIKKHKWFKSIDWDALEAKKMVPPRGCYDDSLRLSEDNLSSPWKDW